MYRLIAFDMDGTLLNSHSEISERTAYMINKATSMGKEVVFCTGRCPGELVDNPEKVPGVRYAICANGSMLYDIWEKKNIFEKPVSGETILSCLSCAEGFDHMFQVFAETVYFPVYTHDRLVETGLGCYTELYDKVSIQIPDFENVYKAAPYPVNKCSIHLTSLKDYAALHDLIAQKNLPVALKFSNGYSVEITSEGVTKGNTLSWLCDYLGIPLSETIAVGDNDNDTDALLTAGLGIAVGNACDSIKKIAGAVVADNDHDGCAEAIEKYLLMD